MSSGDWIGLGIIALVIVGGLLMLNQITKPYDVRMKKNFSGAGERAGEPPD